MTSNVEVLIIGGGVVGLTSALAMASRGYTVALIDAGTLTPDTTKPDQRVYAINHASQILLTQLNIWRHLDPKRLSPYTQMHVWDSLNGAHIDFDSRDVAAPYLGMIIEESVLKETLLNQIAQQPRISLFPKCLVEQFQIKDKGVKLSTHEGSWLGQLLMITDGANSPMRHKLKVELTTWSYKQHALVATVGVEKKHQQTAYQVFNPNGPLAFLPLADSNQCSIVWSVDSSQSTELMALSPEDFSKSLTKAFANKLGKVKLLSERHQFPLQMRHVHQYSGSCWLLLGDAAHTIHPLAGLGLNLGLADVCSWIKCLDLAKGVLVSKKALGAYQRERKHAVWQTIALMEGFKHLFGTSSAPITTLRGLGLDFCNAFTPIKRLFIQHARGIE
jgi:2-octaprenylphenol hydroxylase